MPRLPPVTRTDLDVMQLLQVVGVAIDDARSRAGSA
jgi:hypothetical protein